MARSHIPSAVVPVVDEALAFVCNLPQGDRRQRQVDVMSLVERATKVRAIENGVALSFDGSSDTARMVIDFVLAERDCCAQFSYSILFAPHAGSVELSIVAGRASARPLRDLYLGLAEEKRRG